MSSELKLNPDLQAMKDIFNLFSGKPKQSIDYDQLKQLLDKAGNQTANPGPYGDHLAHLAVRYGDQRLLALVLTKPTGIDKGNQHGDRPLHLAAQAGNERLVGVLLNRYANVNHKNHAGQTPLHLAAEKGSATIMRKLINHGAMTKAADKHGRHPIHMAAQKGDASALQLLKECGADIGALDSRKNTALHYAIKSKNSHFQWFLDRGIKPEAANADGDTPLHTAARADFLKAAKSLIGHHVTLDSKDDQGDTPLHLAAEYGAFSVAQLLLESGASVHARNINQQTPLHSAMRQKGKAKILSALIAAGADVNGCDYDRTAALLYSLSPRNDEKAKILLDAGAYIRDSIRQENMVTGTHYQAALNNWSRLQENGIHPETLTPADIHFAANMNRHAELMQPAIWENHSRELIALLNGLTPCIRQELLQEWPDLSRLIARPQPIIHDWSHEMQPDAQPLRARR